MRPISFQCGAVVLLAILSGTPLHADQPDESVVLQLPYYHSFNYAGVYAAQLQGYYRQAGLQVTVREGIEGGDCVATVLNQDAHYGIEGPGLLSFAMQGKPVLILAPFHQHSAVALAVSADSGIRSPHDLAGKRVMLENTVHDADLLAMLRDEGIRSKVQILKNTWDHALMEGRTDAKLIYLNDAPFRFQQHQFPVEYLRPIQYGIDFYGDSLFTSRKHAESHPEQVRAFREATLRGWQYALKNRDQVIDHLMTLPSVQTRELSREFFHFEAEKTEELMAWPFIEPGHSNPGRWKQMAATFISLEMAEPGSENLATILYDPDPPPNYAWIWYLGGTVAGILCLAALVVGWNVQLRKTVHARTLAIQQSQEALQESEERFRLVTLASREAVYDWDLLTHQVWRNEAFSVIHGSEDPLNGDPRWFERQLHPEDKTRVVHSLETTFKETANVWQEQYRMRRASGDYAHIEDRGYIVRNENGKAIRMIGTFRDVTEQVQVRQELKEAAELYQTTLSNISDAVFLTDAHGRFTYICPNVAILFGYSHEEVWKMETLSGLLGEGLYEDEQLRRMGELPNIDWTVKDHQGRTHDVLVNVKSVSIQGGTVLVSCRDITERKETQRKLDQSLLHYQAVVEDQTELIVRWSEQRKITFVNRAWCRYFQLTDRNAIGQDVFSSVLPEDREKIEHRIRSLTIEGPIITQEYRVRRPDGSIGWQQWIDRAIYREETGELVGFQSVGRDITDRKLTQDRLRTQQALLTHANRLATLGEMVACVAHEIRQPLAAIRNFSQATTNLLATNSQSDLGNVEDWQEKIRAASTRCAEILNRMGTFGRQSDEEFRLCSINELILESVSLLSETLDRDWADVQYEFEAENDQVMGDPIQIEQVLVNLLRNAYESAIDCPNPVQIQIATATRKEQVCISVTDDGPGIPSENVQLFESFSTTKETGMGLGLAVSRSIVESHHGKLWHDDEYQDGARFCFTIPSARQPQELVSVGSG